MSTPQQIAPLAKKELIARSATPAKVSTRDGDITLPPGEVVLLDYVCAACGRAYKIALQASSQPTLIDCNEERLCDACQKKGLVTMLLERGTTVPEERLLTMTVEELFALASAEVR